MYPLNIIRTGGLNIGKYMDCRFYKIIITLDVLSLYNRKLILQHLHESNLKDDDIHVKHTPKYIEISFYAEVPLDRDVQELIDYHKWFFVNHQIPLVSITHS